MTSSSITLRNANGIVEQQPTGMTTSTFSLTDIGEKIRYSFEQPEDYTSIECIMSSIGSNLSARRLGK